VIQDGWLKASLVLPGLAATSEEEIVRVVAEALAKGAGLDAARVHAAFVDAMQSPGFSIGGGVAIPHTEIGDLSETWVCLVTLARPLPARSIDGRSLDIFVFILSKPDPHAHLLLLAHLARLMQSRTFVDGLRRVRSGEEAVALVRAAEARHAAVPGADAPLATGALVLVSISGEKAVDALLIDLVDQGLGDACVIEAQSLREAAAREVPLFAGFRDLFGDPGGRRLFLVETSADRTDDVLAAVSRICSEYGAKDARASAIPVQTRWALAKPRQGSPAGGH
jgi:mannitol/fructose-specific phosphotransferase system IIA component (Ntr-type)